MALTGNQKAYRYALSNVAMSGATRSGYVGGSAFVSVGGLNQRVQIGTLEIVDELNETPNTCRFRIIGPTTVTTGMEVVITLGSMNGMRLFAGHVLDVQQLYWEKPVNVRTDVQAVDYTWLFGFPKVTKRYTNLSASAIVLDLIATYAAANGFTGANVAPNLPTIPEITFTNEDLGEALSRTANRIGAYWYVDYFRDVHFFFTDTAQTPAPLVPTHPSLDNVSRELDRSQALTRVYVEGRGSTLLSAVNIGDTILPLEAVDMFAVSSDVFAKASFQGAEGGAQHLNYTGVFPGGAGTLVGPGIGPSAAPTLTVAPGSGLGSGLYKYAVTFGTAAGESLPSPLGSVTTGVIAAPTAAPTAGTPTAGAGLDPGGHQYAVTFTTAAGETTPGPISVPVVTGIQSVPDPTTAPTGSTPPDDSFFAELVERGVYKIKYAYATDTAIPPAQVTLASPPSAPIRANNTGGPANNAAMYTSVPCSPSPAVQRVHIYRTTNGGSIFYRAQSLTNVPGVFHQNYGSFPSDAVIVTQGTEPAVNTTLPLSQVPITGIPIGGPGVTGRKIYRTKAWGSDLYLWAAIPDNTTTSGVDGTPDASLGAAASPVNTAAAAQVALTNIPLGSGPVTSRKLYRTVVNGSQLKFFATFPDNVSTSGLDAAPDGSLGANIPTGDTSGLLQPDGQIVAGATVLLVAGTGAFQATGGWVVIGNGEQVIRYTGISGSTLIGIPPSGVGAITAAISYNSTVTAAPMLTGIPASGVRSILQALSAGDEIYLVVQVDDATRAAQLAAAVGGTGIREEWVQDRRLSIGEARARGTATLAERALDQIRVTYTSRDLLTRSGLDIVCNLPAPTNLVGTFKIQHVVINNFRPYPTQYPTFTVQASSSRFSFEDLLRLATRDVAR